MICSVAIMGVVSVIRSVVVRVVIVVAWVVVVTSGVVVCVVVSVIVGGGSVVVVAVVAVVVVNGRSDVGTNISVPLHLSAYRRQNINISLF